MPQRGASPRQSTPKLPSSFEPDISAGQRGALPSSFEPEEPDYHDNAPPPLTLHDLIPTPRTALRTVGGAVGGMIGGAGGAIGGFGVGAVPGATIGGAAGASIGESAYQLGTNLGLLEREGPPQSSADVAKSQAAAAALGALQEGVPAAIVGYGPKLLRSNAVKKIVQVTGPSDVGVKRQVGKVAGNALKSFPFAKTTEELLGKYETNLNTANTALEAAYNAVPSNFRFNTGPLVQELTAARNAIMRSGRPKAGAEAMYGMYNRMIRQFGQSPTLSIQELRADRQLWDDFINYYKGKFAKGNTAEVAIKKGADYIRNQINSAFPDIAALNREVSTWTELTKVLKNSKDRTLGQFHPIPFSIAGAASTMMGGTPTNWAEGVLGGAVVNHIMNSTAYKTASVIVQRNVASLLERGAVEQAIKLLARGTSLVGQQYANAVSRMPPPPEPVEP